MHALIIATVSIGVENKKLYSVTLSISCSLILILAYTYTLPFKSAVITSTLFELFQVVFKLRQESGLLKQPAASKNQALSKGENYALKKIQCVCHGTSGNRAIHLKFHYVHVLFTLTLICLQTAGVFTRLIKIGVFLRASLTNPWKHCFCHSAVYMPFELVK